MAANVLSRLAVVITANTLQMVAQLGKANNKLSLMTKSLNTLKNTMLGTFGAYQVINAIRNTVNSIAEFDKQMTAVSVITGSGKLSRGFQMLERDALRIGSSTKFAAAEVASLQLEFGRLGFSTKEILQSTEATVALATATGENLARSAEVAGSTLRGFNLDASEMYRVTDVMSKALNESALTLDSFADGIKYVAPVAASLNVSLEETAAMLSVLSDAGIKGTMAGTSLRRIFTLLTKEGGTLEERMAELAKRGITLAQANDEVGLYAQTSLLILTKYYPRLQELAEAMEKARGETDKMAKAMNDNLDTALTKVGSSWDALILSIKNGKGFLKDLSNAWAETFRTMSQVGIGRTILTAFAGPFASGASAVLSAEAARKELETTLGDDKVTKLIEKQAKQAIETFGDTKEGLESLRVAYSSNTYGAEIYAEAVRMTTQRVKDEATAAYESAEALKQKREELEKLIRAKVEEQRIINEANARDNSEYGINGSSEPLSFGNFFSQNTTNYADSIRGLLDENEKVMIMELEQSWGQAFDSMVMGAERFNESQDKVRDKTMEMRGLAASVAEDFGNFFGEMAEGSLTAAQAMAKSAASIISTLKQITLARMIADSSKFGILGILAAAAGFGLVESLFKRISRQGGGGGSTGGVSAPNQRAIDKGIYVQGDFRLAGNTLIAGIDRAEYNKSRLG